MTSSMKTNDFGQHMIASLKLSTDKQNETEQKLHLKTTNTVTIPHISCFTESYLSGNKYSNPIWSIIRIRRKPLPNHRTTGIGTDTNITKVRTQTTTCIHGSTMEPRWSNCNIEKKHDHCLCKGNGSHEKMPPEQPKTVGNMTEIQHPRTSPDTVGEVMEMSCDKLPQMPKTSAFMFHHNFYPKPNIDLKDAEISQEIRQNL